MINPRLATTQPQTEAVYHVVIRRAVGDLITHEAPTLPAAIAWIEADVERRRISLADWPGGVPEGIDLHYDIVQVVTTSMVIQQRVLP